MSDGLHTLPWQMSCPSLFACQRIFENKHSEIFGTCSRTDECPQFPALTGTLFNLAIMFIITVSIHSGQKLFSGLINTLLHLHKIHPYFKRNDFHLSNESLHCPYTSFSSRRNNNFLSFSVSFRGRVSLM